MNNELRLDLGGTVFRFFFSDKGFDDGGCFWTDACISVKNCYFKYQTGSEFLTFAELQEICDSLAELLNDRITEKRHLGFIEPDLEILLNPKFDRRKDPEYPYVSEDFEIEDISAELSFYLSRGGRSFTYFSFKRFVSLYLSRGGGYSNERYVLTLYRSDIEKVVKFLNEKIASFV